MKVTLKITAERQTYPYGGINNPKVETYTVAEVDGDLTTDAAVGLLRALAASLNTRDERD